MCRLFPEFIVSAMSGEPSWSPSLVCYRLMRTKQLTLRGYTSRLQFSFDEEDLFASVLDPANKSNSVAVHAGLGTESSRPFCFLEHNANRSSFRLSLDGHEAVRLAIRHPGGRHAPKQIELVWSPVDGSPDLHLAAQPPVQAFDVSWGLDFDGRTAKPSAKNCIIVNVETGEQMFFVRKVDGFEFNIDAIPSLPPLMLYALVLALNINHI
jgi:hypothetical protein